MRDIGYSDDLISVIGSMVEEVEQARASLEDLLALMKEIRENKDFGSGIELIGKVSKNDSEVSRRLQELR